MSISYELAKELKDAGFPQVSSASPKTGLYHFGEVGGVHAPLITQEMAQKVGISSEKLVYSPLLEELIEACKEDFVNVCRLAHSNPMKDEYRWMSEGKKTKTTLHKVYGHTPCEAVARLWLKLNKK